MIRAELNGYQCRSRYITSPCACSRRLDDRRTRWAKAHPRAGEFPSPRDKTLIDIRATISAELTGAEVCNGQRTRGGGGKSIDSTKVYRINSTAHLINNDFRRERSVYKRAATRAPPPPRPLENRARRAVLQNDSDNIGGRLLCAPRNPAVY